MNSGAVLHQHKSQEGSWKCTTVYKQGWFYFAIVKRELNNDQIRVFFLNHHKKMFQLYLLTNGKHSQKTVQSTKTDTFNALFFISDFLGFSIVINTKQVHSKFIIYLIFKIFDSVSMQLVQYISLHNLINWTFISSKCSKLETEFTKR